MLRAKILRSIEEETREILAAVGTPGAVTAIVRRDEPHQSIAYGFLDAARQVPMTPSVSYPIASTTKPINAMLLGILIERGIASWDLPLERLPHCSDLPAWAKASTLRDLVSMRTGFARHDWLWFGASISRLELIERLHWIEPAAGNRGAFTYSNLSVTLAAHVFERITGLLWEDLVDELILEPLEMRETTFGIPENAEVVKGFYATSDGTLREVETVPTTSTAPSGGSIYSTVADMARWIRASLSAESQRGLLEESSVRHLRAPIVPVNGEVRGLSPDAYYALGWFIDEVAGHGRVSHAGSLFGVKSDVSLFPDVDIGLVTFINYGASSVARLINARAFECLLGVSSDGQYDLGELTNAPCGAAYILRAPCRDASASDLAGSYVNNAYGELVIEECKGGICIRLGEVAVRFLYSAGQWRAQDGLRFGIGGPHTFDGVLPLDFELQGDRVNAVLLTFEPSNDAIRFSANSASDAAHSRKNTPG